MGLFVRARNLGTRGSPAVHSCLGSSAEAKGGVDGTAPGSSVLGAGAPCDRWRRGDETRVPKGAQKGRGTLSGTGSFGIGAWEGLGSNLGFLSFQVPSMPQCPPPRWSAEVSAGCVPGPRELARTRPLRTMEEVTHCDKETRGTDPARAGRGDTRLFPASPIPPPPAISVPPSAQ